MGLFDFFRKPSPAPRPRRPKRTAEAEAPKGPEDWVRARAPEREIDRTLSSIAEAWVDSLPPRWQPRHLCERYPRIANRLAICWSDSELTQRVLDDLLVDRRGDRQGFPPPVGADLMRLRELHEARHRPKEDESAWSAQSRATYDRRG